MNDLTILGENGQNAVEQIPSFSIHPETGRNTVRLQLKQKSIATALKELLPAQFVPSVSGTLWLMKNNMEFGAACRTEKETLL